MKAVGCQVSLFLSVVLLSGCIGVSIGSRNSRQLPPPPPVVMVPADVADEATLAEIDAAAGLSFEDGRMGALKATAARPALTPAAQVHLANLTYKRMEFDANKVQVLLTLINSKR